MGLVEVIDDIFLIWQHGEEKLRDFITFLSGAHDSIKFTAEWSTERVNFLDVQVIKQDNNLITDLFTKPTDTHQLLHRASCHPNHTKRGIPYSQALRIRRICSEEQFFVNRVADLKTWLLARGYGENDVDDSQIDRVRAKDLAPSLDTRPKEKDDIKIPFVLTYHPAMHKVYEILCKNQNLLLVDEEHEAVFKDKIFVTFRRAKSLKDKLVRAKLPSIDEELMEKGTFRCNGRSCQICPLMREGDTFHNFDSTRSF